MPASALPIRFTKLEVKPDLVRFMFTGIESVDPCIEPFENIFKNPTLGAFNLTTFKVMFALVLAHPLPLRMDWAIRLPQLIKIESDISLSMAVTGLS